MMYASELDFHRPAHLQASQPPELRGEHRGDVRLLVSSPHGHQHAHFSKLPLFLNEGDVLVVNDSATLPASLPAIRHTQPFALNLSTDYGAGLWLAEPRVNQSTPGPLNIRAGEVFETAGLKGTFVAVHPQLERLWFVQFDGDINSRLAQYGEPIRYGYVLDTYGLNAYQSVFARVPGSAEMPSAARAFTPHLVTELTAQGVKIAAITLHTGVSSLEIESETLDEHALYAEPFAVSEQTAMQINAAKREGRRIIAVGTTVVRALASAWNGSEVEAQRGFTQRFIHPESDAGIELDGLLTGFHDPKASHLAMLYAVAGKNLVLEGYETAVQRGYLWHEFGDSHLILTS